jgi:hypothetical protein
MPSSVRFLWPLLALAWTACGDDQTSSEPVAPGGPCTAGDEPPTLRVGRLGASGFEELQEGDPVPAEFGSQLGLEVELLLATTGFEVGSEAPVAIDVELLAEGEPVAHFEAPRLRLRCDEAQTQGELAVVFLLDVSEHSRFTTATELDGQETRVRVSVEDGRGRRAEDEVTVILQL